MKKLVLLSLITSFAFTSNAFAADKRGSIDRVINAVQVDQSTDSSRKWEKATQGQEIFVGNNIRTGLRSVAEIKYDDGTATRIGSRSSITVSDRKLKLKRGYMWGKVDKNKTKGLKIFTSSAVASIIGTEFFIESGDNDLSTLVVLEGTVEFSGKKGKVSVTEGTSATVDKDGNVSEPIPFNKDEVLKRYSELLID